MRGRSGNGGDNVRQWRSFGSLDVEIGDIELRLRSRRAASTLHAADIERKLRDKLSSPIALLVAAGAGFAAGRFGVFRKRHSPAAVDGQVVESGPGIDGAKLLNRIMDGLTLAGTIMSMLPRRDRQPDPATAGAANDAVMNCST
ncbi:MAG: hypothetical protein ABI831_18540 [Betaproteobacteria bacterium]